MGYYTITGIDGAAPTITCDQGPVKYPENCHVCNHHNPYTGKEHMVSIGNTAPIVDVYVCRTCRPKWDREQEVAKLKAEAAECEAAKEALLYGR